MAVRALQYLQASMVQRELSAKPLEWSPERCTMWEVLWLVSVSLQHIKCIKNAMALSRRCS